MPVVENSVRTPKGFPPTVKMLSAKINETRAARALEARGKLPLTTLQRALVDRHFNVGSRRFSIEAVNLIPVADPIFQIGNVEMMAELMVSGIAAAVAALPFLGSGDKKAADGAATQAMRAAMNRVSMEGEIRGGEGGGRDEMGREAALYLGEPVGTGYGPRVHFLVDPLEVTNSAKALNLEKGDYRGGEGWSPEMVNPLNWFPGYSGAMSLLAAADASAPRSGFRPETDSLYLNKFYFPWQLTNRGLSLNSPGAEIVHSASEAFSLQPQELRAAGLGRSRHSRTFDSWIEAGMLDENIEKPTDGDAMLAPAIGSNLLHFGGLTGGVMEGVIGGLLARAFGLAGSYQFVSHDKLGEAKAQANLLDENHKFGFTESERDEMMHSRLFDSEHIGSTLRRLAPSSELLALVINSAHAERDIPAFEVKTFLQELSVIRKAEKAAEGERFSGPSREFLAKVLERTGFLDVRRVHGIKAFSPAADYMYFGTAITPNKWSPLLGIKQDFGRIVLESMLTGGSRAVTIVQSTVRES